MSKWINNKNCKEYTVLDEIINKTNDKLMILYEDEEGVKYVRYSYEFVLNFTHKFITTTKEELNRWRN